MMATEFMISGWILFLHIHEFNQFVMAQFTTFCILAVFSHLQFVFANQFVQHGHVPKLAHNEHSSRRALKTQ